MALKFKFSLLLLTFLFSLSVIRSQTPLPVKWSTSVEKVDESTYNLIIDAKIEAKWHLYTEDIIPSSDPTIIPPNPLVFHFNPQPGYKTIGAPVTKTKKTKDFDPILECEVIFFSKSARYVQKVALTKPMKQITATVEYQACDDKQCIYESEDLVFNFPSEVAGKTSIDSGTAFNASNSQTPALLAPVQWTVSFNKISRKQGEIVFHAKIDKGWHLYSPQTTIKKLKPTEFSINSDGKHELAGDIIEKYKPVLKFDSVFGQKVYYFSDSAVFIQKVNLKGKDLSLSGQIGYMACDDKQCLSETEAFSLNDDVITSPEKDSRSPWGIFIAGIIGGFLAILMPCFYPMIPLTVSFFTKQSSRRKGIFQAVMYGVSIIVIFVVLGFGLTKLFGSDALNDLATNGFFNMLFFLLFVVFAISFFGAFEITLPSSWVNKADRQADRGGLIGIFFMAFTLVLVSFSCTGPIIGSLLVQAAVTGSNLGPIMGMLGFAIAMAIPFSLFALFPSWLNSLPKSGGWMNTLKVVLGFLELALALKFLSNVDLAYHWGILKREIFLVLWIVIFGLTGFYLLGKLKFPHDDELPHLSITRVMFAILFLSFALYLVPGLWGAPVKLTTGLAPPAHYREWVKEEAVNTVLPDQKPAKASHSAECPHGLNCFHDYDEGLAYAKEVGKPVMIDFTGWNCVNCRKMEDYVWVVPRVFDLINNQYVLISLYVDDKRDLPEAQQYVSEATGKMKKVKTIGGKWKDLQAGKYKSSSQPWYVLMDTDESNLAEPRGYTDADAFYNYLKAGLDEFNKRHQK